jgi:hypothetical protein
VAAADAGKVVAGRTQNGAEVTIAKLTRTEYEQHQVEKCGREYDSYEGGYKTKCHTEYERQAVPKVEFLVTGPGPTSRRERFAAGAFADAANVGASNGWRVAR